VDSSAGKDNFFYPLSGLVRPPCSTPVKALFRAWNRPCSGPVIVLPENSFSAVKSLAQGIEIADFFRMEKRARKGFAACFLPDGRQEQAKSRPSRG
jgi:hypothetical protein